VLLQPATQARRAGITYEPSWEINHVPIDQQPWFVVYRQGNDRFKCPGCGKAWRTHGPTWRPPGSGVR
jgi:hypothetical protein